MGNGYIAMLITANWYKSGNIQPIDYNIYATGLITIFNQTNWCSIIAGSYHCFIFLSKCVFLSRNLISSSMH